MSDAEADRTGGSAQAERRALVLSIVGSGAIGSAAVVWGLVARADVIVFDGVYALAGIALVSVSLLASRAAASEPSAGFPFGKHAATPLTVAMQGAALLATLVYGVVGAVGTIVAGGSPAEPGSMLAYGLVSGVASCAVALALSRIGRGSELVRAEVVSWWAGAALSAVVAVGGVVALALRGAGHDTAAGYVDPVLVLVAVVAIVPMPVRLVRDGTYELLEAAPPTDVRTQVERAVAAASARFDLPSPIVRATKLGRRLYVEVDYVVESGRWGVDGEDDVRHAVTEELERLPFEVWATIELTTDPELAE